MATTDKNANRKRPEHARVMLSLEEKDELQRAADQAGLALSVYIRWVALEAARRQKAA